MSGCLIKAGLIARSRSHHVKRLWYFILELLLLIMPLKNAVFLLCTTGWHLLSIFRCCEKGRFFERVGPHLLDVCIQRRLEISWLITLVC